MTIVEFGIRLKDMSDDFPPCANGARDISGTSLNYGKTVESMVYEEYGEKRV